MNFPNREEVDRIKKLYPEGTKLMVDFMDDIQGISSGTIVTVLLVDDIGQIHLRESGLALVPKVDSFHKVG